MATSEEAPVTAQLSGENERQIVVGVDGSVSSKAVEGSRGRRRQGAHQRVCGR